MNEKYETLEKAKKAISYYYSNALGYRQQLENQGKKEEADTYYLSQFANYLSPLENIVDEYEQALKRNEPMKVTNRFKKEGYGHCNNCGNIISKVDDINYCGQCGQRLDWSE